MQYRAHLPGTQVDIIATMFVNQKAKAVRVRRDTATNEIRLIYRQKATAPIAHQLPVTHHRTETPAECLVFVVAVVDF